MDFGLLVFILFNACIFLSSGYLIILLSVDFVKARIYARKNKLTVVKDEEL